MTNEEQRSAEILGLVPRYVGIFAGVTTLLGIGIAHACVGGVKAMGGMLASPRKNSEVRQTCEPESTAEIVTVEPDEVAEDEPSGAPASEQVEGQTKAKPVVMQEPPLGSDSEEELTGDISVSEESGTGTEDEKA